MRGIRTVAWTQRRIQQSRGFSIVILASVLMLAAGANAASESGDKTGAAAGPATSLQITYPFDDTLFPPDLAPPTFRWQGCDSHCTSWRLSFTFGDALPPREWTVGETEWRPDPATWEILKQRSTGRPARLLVLGLTDAGTVSAECRAELRFSTSLDPVEAPIFYRDVNLPFEEAVKDPSDIRWRFGTVSSTEPPPVVLGNLPVCGNCHSFSAAGDIMGMDVDYANNKGSYVITRTAPNMTLQPRDIITWDDFRREDGELTYGLLSQVSPNGRWVVSTVKDKSVFVPRPELAFSQLFFPIKGILGVHDRETRTFHALPGADDPAYVQSNPAWSPDGRWLVFARAEAYDLRSTAGQGKVLLTPEECREFLKDGRPFKFDLYRIPFNDGGGGKAEPLEGASRDGRSHYFPKFSPNGRWIVFCMADNYMLLQPDSELYIIPAEGGPARRLRCNLARMNSWHSWSPNGRWLVFSSKALSDYTQLFLTHIDDEGNSTPPVLLERFTTPNRAANIPEFVNLPPGSIAKIEERFLDDYSFERAGNEFYRGGEPERAIEKYRLALEINPANVNAHQRLGFLLFHVRREFAEGLAHTREALRLDPRNAYAHSDLGMALLNQGQPAEAQTHLQAALEALPAANEDRYQSHWLRYNLGQACMQQGRFAEAATHLRESVRLAPGLPEAHYALAVALARQGSIDETLRHYRRAVGLRPGIDVSSALHELLAENYAKAGRLTEAIRSAHQAVQLAQAAGNETSVSRISARLAQYEAAAQRER